MYLVASSITDPVAFESAFDVVCFFDSFVPCNEAFLNLLYSVLLMLSGQSTISFSIGDIDFSIYNVIV